MFADIIYLDLWRKQNSLPYIYYIVLTFRSNYLI